MKIKLPVVALAALLFAGLPVAKSSAFVAVSVGIAPPVIPIYEQPYAPGLGYIWNPGYWDYADFGYYWVPGIWVRPPRVGLLWTPPYWGYRGGSYIFNNGYWGPTVGFYGGINYGFGYFGSGYYGGRWDGGIFRYNTAVTRVNTTIINNNYVYNNSVPAAIKANNRAAYNGPGGVQAKPNAQERAAMKARHVPPTAAQRSLMQAAKKDPALHAANNKGNPDANAVSKFRNQNVPAASTSPNARAKNARAQRNEKAPQNAKAQRNPRAQQKTADANATGKSARSETANNAREARAQRAEKASTRSAAPKTNRTRPVAKAQRAENNAGPRARSVSPQLQRHGISQNRREAVRPQAATRAAQRPQMQRRQAVRPRPSSQAGRPAQAQPNARKKKRAPGQQPGGR